jgi:hypothetical protein
MICAKFSRSLDSDFGADAHLSYQSDCIRDKRCYDFGRLQHIPPDALPILIGCLKVNIISHFCR